jgi:hypothetical protein
MLRDPDLLPLPLLLPLVLFEGASLPSLVVILLSQDISARVNISPCYTTRYIVVFWCA